MTKFSRPTWARYLAAIILVFAVIQLRYFLAAHLKGGMDGPPLIMMLGAVILAACYGGVGPGVLATIIGAASSDYLFIQPIGTLLHNEAGYDVRLTVFVLEGLFLSWVIQSLRRTTATSRQMEKNLRLIADNTSDVIFAYDMSRQLLYVNPAFESLTGNSINELRENPFMNYIHPDDSPRMQELFEGLFIGKSFKDVEYRIIAHDGEVKWCRATWGPLLDDYASQVGVQGRETDITEQKRSESTLRFLAETCSLLAVPTPIEITLNRIARVAVPQFADWCLIDMMFDDGPRAVAAAHCDASKEPWLVELQKSYPPSLDATQGRGQVLRLGRPEIVPHFSPETVSAYASDSRHLKLLHNLAPRSMMCVPLTGRSGVVGAITFVSSETGRRYDADDLVFANDLAKRIAGAIEAQSIPASALSQSA